MLGTVQQQEIRVVSHHLGTETNSESPTPVLFAKEAQTHSEMGNPQSGEYLKV